MKEAAITQSPHAFVPKKDLTEQEREELYRTRLDESFRPYTVIDVITKVYHRSFEDDLKSYIGEHPEEFKTTSDEWSVDSIWVNDLRIIRPESVFGQRSRISRSISLWKQRYGLRKSAGSLPLSVTVIN